MIDEQKTSLDVSFCRTKAPYAAVYYHGGFLPEVGHLFNSQNLRRDADGFLS